MENRFGMRWWELSTLSAAMDGMITEQDVSLAVTGTDDGLSLGVSERAMVTRQPDRVGRGGWTVSSCRRYCE